MESCKLYEKKLSFLLDNLKYVSMYDDFNKTDEQPFVPYQTQFPIAGNKLGATVTTGDDGAIIEESRPMSYIVPNVTGNELLKLPTCVLKCLNAAQADALYVAVSSFKDYIATEDDGQPRRAGFLLSDGTGTGKGRVNASVILNEINYKIGEFPKDQRCIIITSSKSLYDDYVRDFQDLLRPGFAEAFGEEAQEMLDNWTSRNLLRLEKFSSIVNVCLNDCVLFMTYNELKRNIPPKHKRDNNENTKHALHGEYIGQNKHAASKTRKGTRYARSYPSFEGTSDTEFDDIHFNTKSGATNIRTNIKDYSGIHIVQKFLQNHPNSVIIFDESHNGKNAQENMDYEQSETGRAMIKIQRMLPNAKFVFSTATAATYPKHMGNMTRLGLWGTDKFHKNFDSFIETSKLVDVSVLIPLCLKAEGKTICRQLSMNNIKFSVLKTPQNKEDDLRYDRLGNEWKLLLREIAAVSKHYLKNDEYMDLYRTTASAMWNNYMQFFKTYIKDFKAKPIKDKTIQLVGGDLGSQKSVVISVFSTGEAAIRRAKKALKSEKRQLSGFVSSTRDIMVNTIITHLNPLEKIEAKKLMKKRKKAVQARPASLFDDSSEDESEDVLEEAFALTKLKGHESKHMTMASRYSESFFDAPQAHDGIDDETYARIRRWLLRIREYESHFTPNFIDKIIDELGSHGIEVAELTGREQVVRRVGEKYEIINRIEKECNTTGSKGERFTRMIRQNIDSFNNGEKKVAIISEAACTGISLHCDANLPIEAQRGRVQLVAELSWAAERVQQVFGRINRNRQSKPPEYIFVESSLQAEARFISPVRCRLHNMASLTSGQGCTQQGENLLTYNYNNEGGRQALQSIMKQILLAVSKFRDEAPRDHFLWTIADSFFELDNLHADDIRRISESCSDLEASRMKMFYDYAMAEGGKFEDSFAFCFLMEFKILGEDFFKQVGFKENEPGIKTDTSIVGAEVKTNRKRFQMDYINFFLNKLLGCTTHTMKSFFEMYDKALEQHGPINKVSSVVLPRGVFTVYENQELQVTLQRYIYRNKKKLEVKHGPCSLKSLVVRLGTTFAVVDAMYKESIKRHQGGDIKFGYYIDVSYSVYRRGNSKSRGRDQKCDYYVYLHRLPETAVFADVECNFQLYQSFFMPKYLTNDDIGEFETLFERVSEDSPREFRRAENMWKNFDEAPSCCIHCTLTSKRCDLPCVTGRNVRTLKLFSGDIFAGMDILVKSLGLSNPQYFICKESCTGETITGITSKHMSAKFTAPTRKPSQSVKEAANLLKRKASLTEASTSKEHDTGSHFADDEEEEESSNEPASKNPKF